MKKFIWIFLSLIFSVNSFAADSYSIYLVRHAEKNKVGDDASLTSCGKARANQLADILSNANISKIYSTSYQRTRQTASPLATQKNIAVQNYNPRHLEQLSILLQQRKENSLVVGHSNTTPQLAELLTAQKMLPLTEHDYQQLYQVLFIGEHKVITLLKQPLTCH